LPLVELVGASCAAAFSTSGVRSMGGSRSGALAPYFASVLSSAAFCRSKLY
jgi:hypothetical protein